MSVPEASHVSRRRRRPVAVLAVVLFTGLMGFFRVTGSPRFEAYRTLDVIQLVASGASFGAALFGFMVWLLRPHRCPCCGEARGRIGSETVRS
jgi:hypothetical protein